MTSDDELLLLGVLSGAAMHGYELNVRLQRWLAYLPGAPRPSTAYARLERLERGGLVLTRPERAGRYAERRVYALTEAGRGRFLALMRAALPEPDRPIARPELFLRALSAEEWKALLRERLGKLELRHAELQALAGSHDPALPVHWLARHRLGQLDAERSWIEALLSEAPFEENEG